MLGGGQLPTECLGRFAKPAEFLLELFLFRVVLRRCRFLWRLVPVPLVIVNGGDALAFAAAITSSKALAVRRHLELRTVAAGRGAGRRRLQTCNYKRVD